METNHGILKAQNSPWHKKGTSPNNIYNYVEKKVYNFKMVYLTVKNKNSIA